MKKGILAISLLLSVSAMSWGVTVTDDFNRADTAYSTTGAEIGANWVNSATDLWSFPSTGFLPRAVILTTTASMMPERG